MASSRHATRPGSPIGTSEEEKPDICPETALDLLEDSYAQEILAALREEPRSARCLHQSLEASRATVYRRLDALEEAGLVTGQLSYDPGGNHRQVFHPTVSELEISVTAEGIEVTATPSEHVDDESTHLADQ